ncbi:MAG: hypothetical protein V1782_09250 [Pseudomonadota bacterium]
MSDARIVAKIPGRTRLRISARKGDGRYFTAVREGLLTCGSVREVTVNSATGSVLILHEGEFAVVARHGHETALFSTSAEKEANISPPSYIPAVIGTYRAVDDRVRRLTGGEIDLAGASFLALAGTGVYQIMRGRFGAPAWYTAFWYALNIFLKSRSRATEEKSPR